MRDTRYKFRSGTTLTELAITMTIAPMLVLVVGVLLVSGQRSWQKTYNTAHKQIKEDAYAVTIAFGSIGRKSNRLAYKIYEFDYNTFTEAVGPSSGTAVVTGQAVEFKYWDAEGPTQELLDVEKYGTHYALFYVDDGELKVDYGQVTASNVGAIPDGGGTKRTPDTTIVLTENVSDTDGIEFSHTTLNNIGQGSVRMDLRLTDPDDGETIRVMTATLMRNIWPR